MTNKRLVKNKKDNQHFMMEVDSACKRLLSNKRLIAFLMKTFIEEYMDLELNEIENYLIFDENNSQGSFNIEDVSINNTKIQLDLLYKAYLPNSENRIGILLDIEPQGSLNVDYPIEKRGLYYGSRLLTIQAKEKITYNNLIKVYSIWICAGNNNCKSDVSTISFSKRSYLLNENEINKDYQLINVSFVIMGKDAKQISNKENRNNYEEIIRLFYILLNRGIKVERKQKMLINDYGIIIKKEDIKTMHWAEDIEEGALNYGKLIGKREGIREGIREGKIEATINLIHNATLSFDISLDEAISKLKINEDEIENIKEKYRKKYC